MIDKVDSFLIEEFKSESKLPLFEKSYTNTTHIFKESLDLKEVDPIFASSFEMLIKETFRKDKTPKPQNPKTPNDLESR